MADEPSLRMTVSLTRALSGAPVRVGTENPAKCDAVRKALMSLQPRTRVGSRPVAEIQIVPTAVSSGVSEQPIGFSEIVAGARQRARAALGIGGVLAVGIEDGLVSLPEAGAEGFYNVGCAWVTDGEREGSGFSSGFAYPGECLGPATRDQLPIGELFDAMWRSRRDAEAAEASGRNEGNIGRLTGGRLTRSEYGSHGVLCALVRFLHRDLYD
jgi:inosine/xanthosine triphosphatase